MLHLVRFARHTGRLGVFISAATACITLLPLACSSPPKKPVAVDPKLEDVPAVMRGLIGSEVEFRNTQALLVSGYGLVVGLNGTGGLPMNDQIAATMERQLGLMGVGKTNDSLKGTAIEGKSPSQVLRDRNVAVVQVLAAVAPGLPEGATFDAVVRAVNATSLEGGRLWSTDLRLGAPTTFGQAQTRRIGTARGAVFTSPFGVEDPASTGFSGASGRILGGGQVTESLNVVLQLVSPSHARARAITSAINSRFVPMEGDRGPVARGRSDSNIEVTIPARYRRDPVGFLNLVQNLQIDQSAPERYARRYVEAIKTDPQMGEQLSWALEALGERALPLIRELYDAPELIPQMAGLKAGARLNDPRAASYLRDVARRSHGTVRTEAIALLGKVDAGPRVDEALRELLDDKDLIVRVAAYEALASRAEQSQLAYLTRLAEQNRHRAGPQYSAGELEIMARETLPTGLIQGVERMPASGKFLYDRVRGGVPLIYITQQGIPRIAVFGESDAIALPASFSIWNERLNIVAGEEPGTLKVWYERGSGFRPIVTGCRARIGDLVGLMARKTSPEDPRPGLDLSYSQIVGVLSKLQESGAVVHAFATERDRLNAQLLAAQNSRDMLERPETPSDTDPYTIRRGVGSSVVGQPEGEPDKPTIVPIPQGASERRK